MQILIKKIKNKKKKGTSKKLKHLLIENKPNELPEKVNLLSTKGIILY